MMTFRRVLGTVTALILVAYLVFAVTTMSGPSDSEAVCGDVVVKVQDSLDCHLLDKERVLDILSAKNVNPIGCRILDIDLDTMEKVLTVHPLIVSAECFRTSGGNVKIKVVSSVPVVRVMSRNGADYLLDSRGRRIESRYCVANLPVATGYISNSFAQEKLLGLALEIGGDDFWKNQVEQIYVDENGQVQLVPRVGNHTISLGTPDNVAEKLERVHRFYHTAMNEIGWNKYSDISAAFDGQIVCRKR